MGPFPPKGAEGALGSPWVPLGPLGSPWAPLGSLGFPWVPLGFLTTREAFRSDCFLKERLSFQNSFPVAITFHSK